MLNQHAKWLKVTREIPWRRPIASLNYLFSSHVWRQDHNGFSHQDPGFIDHVVNKKAEIVRVYLPPDANTLLSWPITACAAGTTSTLSSQASSRRSIASPWMRRSSTAPAGSASGIGPRNDEGEEPDVVWLRRRRAHPRALGGTSILRQRVPDLKVRVVTMVDLMRLGAKPCIRTA